MNRDEQDDRVERWIREFQAGTDREGNYGKIYRHFYPAAIKFLVRSKVSRDQAEDVAQLVFTKVFEALDDFAFRSKFSTWLHSICFREMKNHRRSVAALKRKKLSTSLDELQARDDVQKDRYEPPDTDPGPDGRLMETEAFQVLRQAIGELPPQMRRCVSLRVRDIPYQAIADEMEIGLPSVKTHLSLARQRLRPVLDKYFKRIEL